MVAPETGRLLISTSVLDSQRGIRVFPTAALCEYDGLSGE